MTKMSSPPLLHHPHFFLILIFILGNLVAFDTVEGKQTAYACEGSILRLDCEPGRVIHLIRAIYGRFSITICNENGNTEWSVNCGSPKSILVLNGTCNYQRSCSVMASTKTFGDPCPGTVKYLEVQYQCISASSLTSTTPRSVPGGRPNLISPWLTPSSPNVQDNKSSGGGSSSSSTSTSKKGLVPSHNEEPLAPGMVPYLSGSGGNQSSIYIPGAPSSVDFDTQSAVIVTTTSTTTLSPLQTLSTSSASGVQAAMKPSNANEEERESDVGGAGLSNDNEYKHWGVGEGLEVTETTWDWAQFEKPKDSESGAGAGMDGMWLDKMAENSSPTQSPFPLPTQNSHHGSQGDREVERGYNRRPAPDSSRNIGKEYCGAKLDRGMFWNWTSMGETARQPCPGGASGLAKWRCVENPQNNNLPMWYPDSPDLSDCKSAWFLSLQMMLEDDKISNVASDLVQVTSTKQMYGGDIASAVKIIKTIASRMNDQLRSVANQMSREDLAAELLQLILDAGSNLLEKAKLDPWRDLSFSDQMANATALLVGLEDNAFLLANAVNAEKTLRKSAKNILTMIYAIEASNVREIHFPSESTDHWGRMGDVLTMPAEALQENSDGGLVRLVCFAYNNLEHVLQPLEPQEAEVRKLVNSRVISASLNQGRHIQLALPVHLTLRHLWLDNVSNPQCVFWDYTLNAWSEEGCRLVKTNRTHTECQCTHLTNFAILMDLQAPPKHLPIPQMLQVLMYVGSAVVILCLVFTLIITHFCIHGKVFQTMILKNLFICILIGEIIFVFGIHETQKPWVCMPIALLEHYFALASFLWLFLHGFHLHLIVVEAAESGLSRQLWYYGVSYGSPAIVVLLSFLLDPRGYRSENYCWIQTSFALLCFVGPAVVVALATAAVLLFTSYKVCGLLSAMPKKPNDDKALYTYTGTWLRGSLLILVFLTLSWTLRLLDLESESTALSYAASLSLMLQGVAILVFHWMKAEDMVARLCDCGKSSGTSETEMSTHSQQQLQGDPRIMHGSGPVESCHNNHLTQHGVMDDSCLHTLSRQPIDLRNHESIYAKQLAAVGIQPSLGGMPGHRYVGDVGGVLGLYSKGNPGLEGSWTRGSSYSDIRNMGYHHRSDPVYEEIEKPMSPRASVSDLSEDDSHLYPHDVDLYDRNLYCQQPRGIPHYHHRHHGSKDRRKGDIVLQGEAANPLLNRLHQPHHAHQNQMMQQQQQHQQQAGHYTSRHRMPSDHLHHVSMKGLHQDEHILQNVHMV